MIMDNVLGYIIHMFPGDSRELTGVYFAKYLSERKVFSAKKC